MIEYDFDALLKKLDLLGSKCIQSNLIELGFTKTILKKYYPTPVKKDMAFRRHYYIYDVDVVKKFVESSEFKTDFLKSIIRSIAAKKVADEVKMKNLETIKAYNIVIDKLSIKELKKLAINSWEMFNMDIWNDDSKEHTNRLIVNYIRHNLTNYDDILVFNKGKIGTDCMHDLLQDMINEKIYEMYPGLRPNEDDKK